MGTTCTYKPKGQPITEFFIEHGVLRWSEPCAHTYEVLDTALVHLTEYYAAIKQTEKTTGATRVWAAVIKVRMYPTDSYGTNFSYKDMDESMGPYYHNCPERILKLLTPTEYEHANEWRARCWARINKAKARPKIKPGTKLKYGGNEYIADRSLGRRGWMVLDGGIEYRMKPGQVRVAEVIP